MDKSAHILVVDDEANIRMLVSLALSSVGHTVEEAADGNKTLEILAHRTPDIVILDLSMPGLDGIETLERIRQMPQKKRPRVIVLTAYGSIPTAVRATRLGAMDFLEKPVSPDELREAVDTVLAEPLALSAAQPASSNALAGGYEEVLERVCKSMRAARFTDAETLLMKAADLGHKDARYFNLLGVLYEVQHQWTLARKFYGKAMHADKHYQPAEINLRRLYELFTFGRTEVRVALGDEQLEPPVPSNWRPN